MTLPLRKIGSSFRDPAGYVVYDGTLFKRVITARGTAGYDLFLKSGLFAELVTDSLILNHCEEERRSAWPADCAKLLVPRQLAFISYPYEWSYSQLKDAALLTLELQERAQRRGLSLKDASAYNIQFDGCRPVFIDTLSFEIDPGGPWIAYEQFCRHFVGPLLLMQYRDMGAVMLQTALDGFPVGWSARMLPWQSYGRASALLHIHLHAWLQRRSARQSSQKGSATQSKQARAGLLHSLRKGIERLQGPRVESHWLNYRQQRPHYSRLALESKQRIVRRILGQLRPKAVYDLGC